MNVSNFANPLEAVQMISIVSYLNTLSDFLYSGNLLAENDLYKKIPVVDGLYAYFAKNEANPNENMLLIRKLLEGSDLYGEKENEIVDPNFVNAMFNHIISSFVFEEYGNIYGFLAEIIRTSESMALEFLIHDIKRILQNLTFENEDGNDSILSSLSVENILADLILPLFPLPENTLSIVSIDYIYAQAGSIFLRTGQLNSRYFSQMNTPHMNLDSNTPFNVCVGVGHILHNLVDSKKVDDLTLSVFSLPALLHYMYIEKNYIQNENIRKIIIDQSHWAKAYRFLFSYLHFTFMDLDVALESDYRYKLHLALAHFKNRTMLAREKIQTLCSCANKKDIEEKVTEYINHVGEFSCEMEHTRVSLPDLNHLFDEEIHNVTNIYFRFEQESIREVFGWSLINLVKEGKLIILKGSFVNEGIDPSADLLEFYYPDDHKSVHYALVRKDHDVTLIREDDNPTLFRQKLGVSLHAIVAETDLHSLLKNMDRDFEHFLYDLTMERVQQFEGHFHSFDFGHKEQNWWKDFGLSLIPFYSCVTSSIKGNTLDAFISCPMDAILLSSVVGKIEHVASILLTKATRFLFAKFGTTLSTMSSRGPIRALLNIGGKSVKREQILLLKTLEKKRFQDLGHYTKRLNDPRSEVYSLIGKEGVTSIEELIAKVEDNARLQFKSAIPMLEMVKKSVTTSPMAVGKKFHKHTVYVKPFDKRMNTGYGEKFVHMSDDEIAEIRHVRPFKDETLVVYDGVTAENNAKKYMDVGEEAMQYRKYDLFVMDKGLLEKFSESPSEIRLSIYNEVRCLSTRRKRVIEDIMYCPRTPDLLEYYNNLEFAKNYVLVSNIIKEDRISSILKNFYFQPEGKTALDFVMDWMTSEDYSIPAWSYEFRIPEPKIFHDLRFKNLIGSTTITSEEAIDRIETLYSEGELDRIGIPPHYMRFKYIEQRAYYSLRFEDYYALGNQQGIFDSGGYLRLGENTDEARRMRNALYRLAIRQHFDPIEEFPQTLFRGEKRPQNVIDKLFVPGKDFSFGRFTSASNNEETASAFALKGRREDSKILYEINFSGRYLRAKVDKVYPTVQEESVLLPQNKFRIEAITEEINDKIGDHFRVVLSYEENHLDDVKRVLGELKKLKNSGTMFYHDQPKNFLSRMRLCGYSCASVPIERSWMET